MSVVPTATVGQTVSSPYLPSGTVINSNSGAVIPNSTNGQPVYQVGGWYGGQQWNGSSLGPAGQQTVGNPSPTSPGNNTQTTNTPSQPSLEDQMRSAINNGYGQYFNQLDDMLNNGLPQEQQAQQDIVNNSYNTSKGALDTTNANDLQDLDTTQRHTMENQTNNVNTINDNIKNMMQSGANYLGAMGAGDSSAANQYAYALAKLGSQQQGNLMNQTNSIVNDINDRRNKVNNIYTQELNSLNNEHGTNLANIAQWFADAQNQIKQAKGEGAVSQGKDLASLSSQLLNAALGQLGMLQQNMLSKRNALQQWAVYNSQNIPQLQANMDQLGSVSPQLPVANFGNVSPSTAGPAQNSYAPGNQGNQLTDQLKNMGISFL